MEPGEMIEYKAKHYQKKSVDPKLYSAWTDNRIILNHTSLREMTNMLKDNYGLKVIVRDTSLLSQTVSGSMPLGDDDILIRQLAKAFQLKITRENNSILIEEP
jgi:ferric-dicitrate binding protein FerR (iron transport regulator)